LQTITSVVLLLSVTGGQSEKQEKKDFNATPIIIAVVVFVVLLVLAILGFCLYRRHKKKEKESNTLEGFDNNIVFNEHDASVHVSYSFFMFVLDNVFSIIMQIVLP